MLFQDWGEEDFVQFLKQSFLSNDSSIGIGDDCAVILEKQGKTLLVTTDALVEGIHFLKDQISALDLGYKSIAVNVSDITAKGGNPKYAFLTIALPKTTDATWVRHLIEGIKEGCLKWNLSLLGGDTVGSKRDIFINLTLIGTAEASKIKYRHQAQSGDIICVTGSLGDSGGGFKAISEKISQSEAVTQLTHAHFRPEPYPEQGIWLAAQNEVHAMMDLSDGLGCDLDRLIKSSQKGAEIELSKIPISAYLSQVCLENDWDPLQLALTGGEDYCLLVTISPHAFEAIRATFQDIFKMPLFDIGKIVTSPEKITYYKQGKSIRIDYKPFDHFQ